MFAQVQGLFPETLNLQWQIQDFWDSNPRGALTYYLRYFLPKTCVKMKKVDRESPDPPLIYTTTFGGHLFLTYFHRSTVVSDIIPLPPRKIWNERSKDRQAEHTTNCTVVVISRVSFAKRTGEATVIETSASEGIYLMLVLSGPIFV